MAFDNVFTKKELQEMWKRSVERQYNIAFSKVVEAILKTDGDIWIGFSGGKDSSLVLDMYCEALVSLGMQARPVKVKFADTTNETTNMYKFIRFFIDYVQKKYGVIVEFEKVRPEISWAHFCKENGIPLISKDQARRVRTVKSDMRKLGVDYDAVCRLFRKGDISAVRELQDLGFSKTSILALTGYVDSREEFGKKYTLSRKWLPMVNCPVDLTEQCCINVKEKPLDRISSYALMTGEQAAESTSRTEQYLRTGCNFTFPDGSFKSKPLGAMTANGVLYALKFRGTPICTDYGEIVCEDGCYKCTKAQRTGCALCGFGCQYDTERFVRLQDTEPAKLKFAFKSKEDGGLGYKEAIEYMNEYCGTNVIIPEV